MNGYVCDVFAQGCTGDLVCVPINVAGETDCVGTTGKADGAPCSALNDCVKGLLCAGSGANATCQPICNLATEPDACTTGTCSSVGFENNIGACAPD